MTLRTRLARQLTAALLVASALVLLPGLTGEAHAAKAFNTHVSCANSAPFKPAHHCSYDKRNYFRGTFVFKSNIGKRAVKACFRIVGGGPLDGGGGCAKVGPLSFKAYPFKITGVTASFTVKFTWATKKPGAKGPYKIVSRETLKVRP